MKMTRIHKNVLFASVSLSVVSWAQALDLSGAWSGDLECLETAYDENGTATETPAAYTVTVQFDESSNWRYQVATDEFVSLNQVNQSFEYADDPGIRKVSVAELDRTDSALKYRLQTGYDYAHTDSTSSEAAHSTGELKVGFEMKDSGKLAIDYNDSSESEYTFSSPEGSGQSTSRDAKACTGELSKAQE